MVYDAWSSKVHGTKVESQPTPARDWRGAAHGADVAAFVFYSWKFCVWRVQGRSNQDNVTNVELGWCTVHDCMITTSIQARKLEYAPCS